MSRKNRKSIRTLLKAEADPALKNDSGQFTKINPYILKDFYTKKVKGDTETELYNKVRDMFSILSYNGVFAKIWSIRRLRWHKIWVKII